MTERDSFRRESWEITDPGLQSQLRGLMNNAPILRHLEKRKAPKTPLSGASWALSLEELRLLVGYDASALTFLIALLTVTLIILLLIISEQKLVTSGVGSQE